MSTPTPEKTSTVLIVDDNDDNLTLLRAVMEKAGFSTHTAGSVAQARQILSAHPAAIDLVLSDISMPGETGFDLLAWIRQEINRTEQIPVLLITAALPEDSNRIKGLSMGAVDYIVRPISNQELVLRVRHALDHYKQFKSLQRALQTSEDMAVTGQILAAANHEIRNLVGLIQISSDQALACAERAETIKPGTTGFKALSATVHATKLLSQVSRDLNTHINAERVQAITCCLRDIISDVVTLISFKLRGITIDSTSIDQSYFVLADATRVKQILINFSLNALDSILEKGPISQGRLEIKVTESTPSTLQIRFKDNGIGLLTEGRKTSFKPFETTKAVRGGKGLGLWLCSRLASAMDGHICLESKGPGLGATAILELKRTDAPMLEQFDIEDYM